MEKNYSIPEQVVDVKEEQMLVALTDTYKKLIEPTQASKALKKVSDKIPESVKLAFGTTKEKVTEAEIFIKSLQTLAKAFQKLEQYASKVTLSEKQVVSLINDITPDNEITSLDEICLVRGYDISKLVNKLKLADISAAAIEGAATGAPGFIGLPFNLVLSTFLYYRAVQSIAMFYGYDVKNDPAELQIASEVFMDALSPKSNNDSDLSNTIAKVMLLTTATSVKQTVNKGWQKMAEKGGVHLLLTQMRALANNAAKRALEKAGKKGLEKTAFTEVFEQIGRRLTQKAIGKAIPYVGAVIGMGIDTAQMIKVTEFANVFYSKRFILEKELRINALVNGESEYIVVEDYEEIVEEATEDVVEETAQTEE